VRRVAVNLLWCVPGQVGGSEEYLVRQLLGLSELTLAARHDVEPTLFALPGFSQAHPDLAAAFRVVDAPVDGSSRPRRVFAEHTWLAEQTAGSALVHHGGGTVPARGTQPTLLTIHDLQYLTYPQYMSPVKRRYLDWTMPRSVGRATAVAVPSEYVRGSVVDAYGCDPDLVAVVPHGMEPTLGRAATGEHELRAKYGLGGGPVIVLPAMTHPHKGHRFLLRVMAASWKDPALRLVLVGGVGAAERDVAATIAELGLGGRVVRTGRVPAHDRDGLLMMAAAMMFPSEYEGFGAPVIEAMTLGAPVICSDRTCLPEVAGEAAIVLPLQPDAWAGALDCAIDQRDRLIAAGHIRAKAFTSKRSAEALLVAYGRVLQ
jgi:glycosyltransferase involved in cell wall biosynthesis